MFVVMISRSDLPLDHLTYKPGQWAKLTVNLVKTREDTFLKHSSYFFILKDAFLDNFFQI